MGMFKWQLWMLLALVGLVTGVMNFFAGNGFLVNALQFVLFSILGVSQFFCEKKGEEGKRIMRWIYIGMLGFFVLLVIGVAILVAVTSGM